MAAADRGQGQMSTYLVGDSGRSLTLMRRAPAEALPYVRYGPAQPEKRTPLPKVVTLNKALKLAQAYMYKMSVPKPDEPSDKDFEGRPSRLCLGAKVAPDAKRAASTDPVERKLLKKVNAHKRKFAEEEGRTSQEVNEVSNDDSGENESRTSAFNKKRTWSSVTSVPSGKKAK